MTSERKERRQMKTTSVPVFCSSGTYWTLALGPTVSMSRGGQCSKFEDVEATEIYGAKYHTGGTSTKFQKSTYRNPVVASFHNSPPENTLIE